MVFINSLFIEDCRDYAYIKSFDTKGVIMTRHMDNCRCKGPQLHLQVVFIRTFEFLLGASEVVIRDGKRSPQFPPEFS